MKAHDNSGYILIACLYCLAVPNEPIIKKIPVRVGIRIEK